MSRSPSSSRSMTTARCSSWRCRSRARATSRSSSSASELVVGVDGHKRTIMLPPALAGISSDRGDVRGRHARGALRWLAATTAATAFSTGARARPSLTADGAAAARAAPRRSLRGGRAADRRGGGGGDAQATGEPGGSRASPPTDRCPSRERSGRLSGTEIELLLDAVRALRDRIPPDLQRRLGEALRELLLAIRALIDWYLERTQPRASRTRRGAGHPDPLTPRWFEFGPALGSRPFPPEATNTIAGWPMVEPDPVPGRARGVSAAPTADGRAAAGGDAARPRRPGVARSTVGTPRLAAGAASGCS